MSKSKLETMMQNKKFSELGENIRKIQESWPPKELRDLKAEFHKLLIEEKVPYEVAYTWVWNNSQNHREFCMEMAPIREICLSHSKN